MASTIFFLAHKIVPYYVSYTGSPFCKAITGHDQLETIKFEPTPISMQRHSPRVIDLDLKIDFLWSRSLPCAGDLCLMIFKLASRPDIFGYVCYVMLLYRIF